MKLYLRPLNQAAYQHLILLIYVLLSIIPLQVKILNSNAFSNWILT